MFVESGARRPWTKLGLSAAIISAGLTVALSVLDGIVRGPMLHRGYDAELVSMLSAWCFDFRNLFEQLIYVGTLMFVAAKFFEGRTILTIGFDKLNSKNVLLNGPDENNVVWIGHRYETSLEAQAIAEAFNVRLKESVAARR
jgi:hypothetical protein